MSGSTIIPWVVGNWKMNPQQSTAIQLVQQFKDLLKQQPISEQHCHIGVAPISIALTRIQSELASANRAVATVAQDVSRFAGTGAYTGEVSADLLTDSQIQYVLIGHSERRELLGDQVEILKQK